MDGAPLNNDSEMIGRLFKFHASRAYGSKGWVSNVGIPLKGRLVRALYNLACSLQGQQALERFTEVLALQNDVEMGSDSKARTLAHIARLHQQLQHYAEALAIYDTLIQEENFLLC